MLTKFPHLYSQKFSFKLITTKEIKQLLQSLCAKKAVGVDIIPPKLVNLAASPLSKLQTEAINLDIFHSIFPGSVMVALVAPLRQ